MGNNQNTENKDHARPHTQRSRPTIGFVTSNVWSSVNTYPTMIWTGVTDAARERDANLICFAGGSLGVSAFEEFNAQRNVLYDLVTSDSVDGLVISSAALSHFVSPQELQAFCDRYRPLPMVSIAAALEGIPSALVDNVTGLRDAVSHLIEAHGYRRIACLRRPEGHAEADARYRAYTEALAAHGLPLNPDLVASGMFTRATVVEAMRLLLDERKLRPGVDFEAIVAVTDDTALGALDVLRARGVQVPYDVALVGFDDAAEARVSTPALTTVRQSIYEQGKRAVEMLLALLAGEDVPEQVILPTEMVVRRSCGCHSQTVLHAAAQPVARAETPPGRSAGTTFAEALVTQREAIVAAMAQTVASDAAKAVPATTAEWAGQVLDGFAAAMQDGSSEGFLSTLDRVLRQVVAASGDLTGSAQSVTAWQGALSAQRRHVLSWLGDNEALSRAENLWQQARLFIAEAAQQAERHRELQAEQQTGVLRAAGQAMMTTPDVAALMDVIAQELPRLGIPSTYLSLYEGQELPPQECRLILAYDEDGRVTLEAGGLRFPSRALAPERILPQARRYSMVVEPLYLREHQLGLALFEMGPRDGAVYEMLREQISSALQAALLTQQVRRRALRLQTAAQVSRAASSILDPDELIRQVVDLVRDRFGLYYAGLFLVEDPRQGMDQTGQWAVLQAGTGEAGQKMLEQGHKLEIGGNSMIGWCVANGQARIALDVGEEAVRFANPLLPLTRSEMALPLVSRGRVFGAMTIQSDQPAAFTQEDITVLQTMADQLANAIENARLFEQTSVARQQAEARVREMQILQGVIQAASSTLDLERVLDALFDALAQEMGFTYIALVLIDESANELRTARAAGLAQGMNGLVRPLSQLQNDIVVDVARKGQIEVIDGWDDRFDRVVFEREGHAALVRAFVPLRLQEEPIGTLEVGYRRQERAVITPEEVRLLGSLAGQVAVAVGNARLFDESKEAHFVLDKRVKALDCLNDIGRKMEETPPIPDFLRWVAEHIPLAMQYPDVCVIAFEYGGQVYGAPEALTLPRQMVQGLHSGGALIGRVCIAYTEEHDFLDEESALLGDITRRVNGYIENQQLLSETQARAYREQILREVTARVRGSTDPDTVMRTLARELGTALDRPTFVRLGSTEELSEPKAPRSRKPPVGGQAPVRINPEPSARGNGLRPPGGDLGPDAEGGK